MATRKELYDLIEAKKAQIITLRSEMSDLVNESYLLSDEEQWFTEVEEEHIVSKRPKKTQKFLIGRIHWNQDFMDEDTQETITINRNRIVRQDGEWV